MITLFQQGDHKNVMFDDFSTGEAVQANQHLIVHARQGMLLDPGGHKVYTKLFAEMAGVVNPNGLKYLFFSHQDPDIVAAANGWLMVTDAEAYVSSLWTRFIPHFGVDELVINRMHGVPDTGTRLDLNGAPLLLVPAHFLHSAGNLQVFDPVAKILYTGDLGASLGAPMPFVEDFDAHIQFMEGFHQRYMASNRALRAWARMARDLDVEIIAPQHGAVFRGREMVQRFITWAEGLQCGVDLLPDGFAAPA